MERRFWLERWSNQEIGFHQPQVNPWLEKCWPQLGVPEGAAVFVPLCGKSLDMGWLAEQGHPVIGVELAEAAVRAFFQEANEPCRIERIPHLLRYTGGRITVYCGDFMDLSVIHLPGVAAVYDRGGLVALPPRMRLHYADHLQRIVPEGCRMLLITLEYDQERIAGPPHSVTGNEVQALFGERCSVDRLCAATTSQVPPRFAQSGIEEAEQVAYKLVKRS